MGHIENKLSYSCVDELCPIFKDLDDSEQLNYLSNSDGPLLMEVDRFFYLANLTHSIVNIC